MQRKGFVSSVVGPFGDDDLYAMSGVLADDGLADLVPHRQSPSWARFRVDEDEQGQIRLFWRAQYLSRSSDIFLAAFAFQYDFHPSQRIFTATKIIPLGLSTISNESHATFPFAMHADQLLRR